MPFGEGASEMAALPNFCIMSQRGEGELERTESRLKGKGGEGGMAENTIVRHRMIRVSPPTHSTPSLRSNAEEEERGLVGGRGAFNPAVPDRQILILFFNL